MGDLSQKNGDLTDKDVSMNGNITFFSMNNG
jgi:hypothetical protein